MKKIIVVMSQREDLRRHYVHIIRERYAGHFSILQTNAKQAYDEAIRNPKEIAVLVLGKSAYKVLGPAIEALHLPIILVKEGASAGGRHESTYRATRKTFEEVLERILEGNK